MSSQILKVREDLSPDMLGDVFSFFGFVDFELGLFVGENSRSGGILDGRRCDAGVGHSEWEDDGLVVMLDCRSKATMK